MKRLTYLIMIVTVSHAVAMTPQEFQLKIEPKWDVLDTKSEQFGSSWVLVGSITFKKKSKEQERHVPMHRHDKAEKKWF